MTLEYEETPLNSLTITLEPLEDVDECDDAGRSFTSLIKSIKIIDRKCGNKFRIITFDSS